MSSALTARLPTLPAKQYIFRDVKGLFRLFNHVSDPIISFVLKKIILYRFITQYIKVCSSFVIKLLYLPQKEC